MNISGFPALQSAVIYDVSANTLAILNTQPLLVVLWTATA
jgi:hypothetical protein